MIFSNTCWLPVRVGRGLPAGCRVSVQHRQRQHPKSLIVIFQRGGCDGLNVVVPYGEDAYYRLRPTIAIAKAGQANGALDLNGFFGLHPAMASLHKLYQQGAVAVFPAVHYPNATMSHFDSELYIENAVVNKNSNGWLNRHLETLPATAAGCAGSV